MGVFLVEEIAQSVLNFSIPVEPAVITVGLGVGKLVAVLLQKLLGASDFLVGYIFCGRDSRNRLEEPSEIDLAHARVTGKAFDRYTSSDEDEISEIASSILYLALFCKYILCREEITSVRTL